MKNSELGVDGNRVVRSLLDLDNAAPVTPYDGAEERTVRARLSQEKMRRHDRRARLGILALSTATVLAVATNPNVQGAVETVVDGMNNALDQDRTFNPDAGNPSNAEQIIEAGNTDPSKVMVEVEMPQKGGPQSGSPEYGQDPNKGGGN